jgi:hypothetical protein
MKPWIILAGTLCGCAAAPLPQPPPPTPVVITPPDVSTAPVASVVQAYRAVERKEVPKITADNVTADYVRGIHAADIKARHALAALERLDGKATPKALAAARSAVSALAAALDSEP